MPTQSVLKIVDEMVGNVEARAGRGTVGMQAALVRTLIHEVERHHPADQRVTATREQLCEELEQLSRCMRGAPETGERATRTAQPIGVLVVEDDDQARTAIAGVLRSLDYPCRTVRSASEALLEYDREPAAIVVSDWNMPGMSGFELCMLLKRRELQPYVILVTAAIEHARVLDGVCGGADDFLCKPIDIDELEVRLQSGAQLVRALRTGTDLNEQLRTMPA